MKPRIVYMGTPEFAVEPLKLLLENGFEIAGVVTVPDKPGGRGLKLSESEVKKFYLSQALAERGIALLQPVSLKDPDFLIRLAALNADLFIVVAFRMLPEAVWQMPRLGTFNLHGSLLPKYRGAAPINWAIIRGEEKSGVTTFLIDKQIDTGNILLQRECPVTERETIGTLYHTLMHLGAGLVVETVNGLAAGILTPKPQTGTPTDAPKLTKETGKIRWDLPAGTAKNTAAAIERLVRGLSPYPAATGTLSNGEKTIDLKIFEVSVLKEETPDAGDLLAGTISSDGKTYLYIRCADGSQLALEELQLAGKKRMYIKEFLLGFRNPETYRFI